MGKVVYPSLFKLLNTKRTGLWNIVYTNMSVNAPQRICAHRFGQRMCSYVSCSLQSTEFYGPLITIFRISSHGDIFQVELNYCAGDASCFLDRSRVFYHLVYNSKLPNCQGSQRRFHFMFKDGNMHWHLLGRSRTLDGVLQMLSLSTWIRSQFIHSWWTRVIIVHVVV